MTALIFSAAAQASCGKLLAPMLKEYQGEGQVLYLTADERRDFEIHILQGEAIFEDLSPLPEALGFLYVLSQDSKLYVAPLGGMAGEFRFRHSSFVAGAPVLAAGQGKYEDGVFHLNRASGHYEPRFEHLLQIGQWLVDQGVDPKRVRLYDSYIGITDGQSMSELVDNLTGS